MVLVVAGSWLCLFWLFFVFLLCLRSGLLVGCSLFVDCCVISAVTCDFVVCCLLSVVCFYGLVIVVRSWLVVGCCFLFHNGGSCLFCFVCCVLCGVCCLLFVLLSVVCCVLSVVA